MNINLKFLLDVDLHVHNLSYTYICMLDGSPKIFIADLSQIHKQKSLNCTFCGRLSWPNTTFYNIGTGDNLHITRAKLKYNILNVIYI